MHTHKTPVRTLCLALAAALCLLNATFMVVRKSAMQQMVTAEQQADDRDARTVLSILPSLGPASMIGMHGLTAIAPAR